LVLKNVLVFALYTVT